LKQLTDGEVLGVFGLCTLQRCRKHNKTQRVLTQISVHIGAK